MAVWCPSCGNRGAALGLLWWTSAGRWHSAQLRSPSGGRSSTPTKKTEEKRRHPGTPSHTNPSWALELLQLRVVHEDEIEKTQMNHRHKPNILQTPHELFQAPTGVTRCHCTNPVGGPYCNSLSSVYNIIIMSTDARSA